MAKTVQSAGPMRIEAAATVASVELTSVATSRAAPSSTGASRAAHSSPASTSTTATSAAAIEAHGRELRVGVTDGHVTIRHSLDIALVLRMAIPFMLSACVVIARL